MSGGGGGRLNAVFYAERYHPIQAGSIDGTDILPHDNGIFCALLCSNANLYDPFGDPKVIGDPYRTLFVGRLSHLTDDETFRQAMSKYGRVKNMRLVRDIVTGASRGYAFVEYESDREMRRAYEDAHHSIIDGSEVIVDYYRQHLMPGWIPRRLDSDSNRRGTWRQEGIWSAPIRRSREAISSSSAAHSLQRSKKARHFAATGGPIYVTLSGSVSAQAEEQQSCRGRRFAVEAPSKG